jgi:putative SOS response-associated peptidase YedK
MPLVLPSDRWSAWLDPDRPDPKDLLAPDRALVDRLELRPVSMAVNSVKNNSPELLDPVAITEAEQPEPTLFELS